MSQYKVPQNVEAEDKILGPLTFKQFIYACIGVGWALICFAIFRVVPALMVVIGFPPTMLFLLLAFYTRDGQNFEQLLLAMVGFFAAARRRLWVKENVVETFHIEPTPLATETTQRNPTEVRSELEKLAGLIDSRGWNRPPDPETKAFMPAMSHEDRIVAPPAAAPSSDDEPHADMLDLKNSPLAQNLAQLLTDAASDVRTEAVSQMNQPIHHRRQNTADSPSTSDVTPSNPDDILKLATSNDDLTVSQIAAQATRLGPGGSQPQMVDTNANAR